MIMCDKERKQATRTGKRRGTVAAERIKPFRPATRDGRATTGQDSSDPDRKLATRTDRQTAEVRHIRLYSSLQLATRTENKEGRKEDGTDEANRGGSV